MRNAHLQYRARFDIERGFPQLLGIHLTEPLVARNGKPLAADFEDRLEQRNRAGNGVFLIFRHQRRMAHIVALQLVAQGIQPARFGRIDDPLVDHQTFGHAAQGALEHQRPAVVDDALPTALERRRQRV